MASPVATAPLGGAEAVAAAPRSELSQPELSVVIKALNEADKIEACIRSILAATDPATTEIIVADSLSDDATVAIAARFPVKVVQLTRREDRSCGAGGQLGFQYASGKRLMMIDGDMELDPDFLVAGNAALDADPTLAGVAGLVVERVMTLEFKRRNQRRALTGIPGLLDHLACGGLYRMDALRSLGYFTDRNLHAFEELDLGLRLGAAGWRLRRLDQPSVYHYGHATAAFPLLIKRWQTRYLHGHGELLRSKWGTKLWWRTLRGARLSVTVMLWWLTLLALLAGMLFSPWPGICNAAFTVTLLAPVALQILRKRSVPMGLYSVALINFHAAGLIPGMLRPRVDPRQRIDSTIRHPET